LPPGLVESLRVSISFSLHYCLSVLKQSPAIPSNPKSITEIHRQLDPFKPRPENGENWEGPWTLLLWNDEKHSYDQVIEQLCRAFEDYDRAAALEAASRVDDYGRALVLVSSIPARLYSSARLISTIELAVTVRSANATFQESICGLLIDWLVLLTRSPNRRIRQLIAEEMLRERKEEKQSAFQCLLKLDARLWKRARLQLRYLYTSLMATDPLIRVRMGTFDRAQKFKAC
jgi:E3 ubiquitin-protein ligase UBR1